MVRNSGYMFTTIAAIEAGSRDVAIISYANGQLSAQHLYDVWTDTIRQVKVVYWL